MIWEKDLWVNPNIPYLFNREIIEYDMKSAGLSLIREYKLLPDKQIEKLLKLGKQDLNRKIGLMERDNKELVKQKKEAFKNAREAFFRMNGLEDNDVLAIKKDAIFCTKRCKNCQIGTYILFREKNRYSSYIKLNKGKLELYYSHDYTDDHLDVKGIGEENLKLHDSGMTAFFWQFFRHMEMETAESTLMWMRTIVDMYKSFQLPLCYYRQFNAKSSYILKNGEEYMEYWDDKIEDVDISYNYYLLMNLLKILL